MAQAAYQLSVDIDFEQDFDSYVGSLEVARSQIEARFLDGGAAILSILDILNKLVASLDHLTSSLDERTADLTMGELQSSAAHLSRLIEVEATRQDGFRSILDTQRTMGPHVRQMQETLRYLRTFALTAKITGAGIPDFSAFAEEILRRIQDGTNQVNDLSNELGQLGRGLGPAIDHGEAVLGSFRASIPSIVSDLSAGIARITGHRRELVGHATAVKTVAARIQTKLGTLLNAMQIGDMTRQRIEHCQSSFAILEEVITSDAAAGLDQRERDELTDAVRQLVALQLDEMVREFSAQTRRIVTTVASFQSDLTEIASLRLVMTGGDGSGNAMQDLETGIASARNAVRQIEAVAQGATSLNSATAATVNELVAGIGIVQVVRTDIHYMALNTNLRCSRLGEEGKAINVVTAELRNFAAQLDDAASSILTALNDLEAASSTLATDMQSDDTALDTRLENALGGIREAARRMEIGIEDLAQQSESAETQISSALSRLDFDAQLGDILRQCAASLATDTRDQRLPARGAVTELLGGRIFKLYTMASERSLHSRIFGVSDTPVEEASFAVDDDDDVFDALF